jgi:hypothetical protein
MPWVPIPAQAHNEERPPVTADGVQIEATSTVNEQEVPAAKDLSSWSWDQYRLESNLSGKLGFNVGAVEGARNARTLITEFSRSKAVASNGTSSSFGVAARLIVNVSGLDAQANLTLPFVAAEAQYNRVEAFANLRVAGYADPKLGEKFPDFGTFNVESYVTLMQAMNEIRKVIGANEDLIRPERLWAWDQAEADELDRRLTEGVAAAWALTEIAKGHPREHALAAYEDSDDDVAQGVIERTYTDMLHGDEKPSGESRERARRLLDGYQLRKPGWLDF